MHFRSLLCCSSGDIFADPVASSSDAKKIASGAAVGSSLGYAATLLI
jgi:hypothetical protein